jgi:hypothetical protein
MNIGAMTILLNFIKTGSCIRNIIEEGIQRHADSMEIA